VHLPLLPSTASMHARRCLPHGIHVHVLLQVAIKRLERSHPELRYVESEVINHSQLNHPHVSHCSIHGYMSNKYFIHALIHGTTNHPFIAMVQQLPVHPSTCEEGRATCCGTFCNGHQTPTTTSTLLHTPTPTTLYDDCTRLLICRW